MAICSQHASSINGEPPRLLEEERLDDEETNEVIGVLWEIVEMVNDCDFTDIDGLHRDYTRCRPGPRLVVRATAPSNQSTDEHDDEGELSGSEEEWSVSSISSDEEDSTDIEDLSYPRERTCNRCHHEESVIEARGYAWEDWLENRDMGSGEEVICRSCSVGENDFFCVDCGYSETLCKQYHGEQLGQFYREGETRPDYQDENTRCNGCRARVERYERESEVDEPRLRFARVLFPENDEEEVLLGDHDEWSETYEGELEPVEDDGDNNEEKAMRVKQSVQEMGEILFDIKDKITEGEYLKMMDCLQSVTNEMNH